MKICKHNVTRVKRPNVEYLGCFYGIRPLFWKSFAPVSFFFVMCGFSINIYISADFHGAHEFL